MQALLPLGNDIVDLDTAHNKASAANSRYAHRVLAPVELTALAAAARHDCTLWALWTAKEAAYKALKKTDRDLVFAHRRFVVTTTKPQPFNVACGTATGCVSHHEQQLKVIWTWTDNWMHCVTGSTAQPVTFKVSPLAALRNDPAFARMKCTSSLSDQSVTARLLALSLLEELGISDVHIVRPRVAGRRGPPRVMHNAALLPNLEVSLSHDGLYAAAAVSRGI